MAPALLDFDLYIARADHGYAIRLVNSPRGSLPAQAFVLPFALPEVDELVDQFLYDRNRQSDLLHGKVKQFGAHLYEALFAEEIRVSLWRCLDTARDQGVPLRIKLRLHEVPELAGLPWEFLYDESRDSFLALDNETVLVHSLELAERIEPLSVMPPLHMLTVISNPRDLGIDLDAEAEWSQFRKSIDSLIERKQITLSHTNAPTLAALQGSLSQEEVHILHFIGHGAYETGETDGDGRGVLLFTDDNGNAELVDAEKLGRLLHNAAGLRLVVLNACEGARTAHSNPFAGVAQTLLRQGIPAIIAMQFPISDSAARIFSSEFYAGLADGHSVDRALTSARLALYTRHSSSEWGTPRLFMHASDGILWQLAPKNSTTLKQAGADAARTDTGLSTLAALMQDSSIRKAVVAFQTDLEAAAQEVERLAALKEMHDHLHNVEFQCYRIVEQERVRFPEDETAVQNLLDNELTLQDLTAKIRVTATGAVLTTVETMWIEDLVEAQGYLSTALTNQDAVALRRCLNLLRRLLTTEPSRINERLNRSAASLRLRPIEEALTAVADRLAAGVNKGEDRVALTQLTAGVQALKHLHAMLDRTLADHGQWQNLDVELRRVDAVLVHDLDELIFTWPDVREQTRALCLDENASWVQILKREEEQLDRSLLEQNPALVRRCFYRFRRQAGIRFYQVDTELKDLCGEVARIAAPLDSVLRMLG